MQIEIAVDHGGFDLKEKILKRLLVYGHEMVDFGAKELYGQDDYPDYVLPLVEAVTSRDVHRGIGVLGQAHRAQALYGQARPRHAGYSKLAMES